MATFIAFIHLLAIERDTKQQGEIREILASDRPIGERAQLIHSLVQQHGAFSALMTRQGILLEMLLCRAADSYISYLTELLALIFTTRPESLRSDEKVSFNDILQFSEMKDVVAYLAEEKVLKLAYKGMRDLATELGKRPGLTLFNDQADLENAIRIIELRNLLAHNRGVVNRLFKTRLPNYPAAVGDRLILPQAQVFQDIDFFARSVCDIEARAAVKFGVQQPVSGEQHERQFQGLTQVLDLFDRDALIQTDSATPE